MTDNTDRRAFTFDWNRVRPDASLHEIAREYERQAEEMLREVLRDLALEGYGREPSAAVLDVLVARGMALVGPILDTDIAALAAATPNGVH